MAFRIILVLVVVIIFIFPEILGFIKTTIGVALVGTIMGGIGGLFVNWFITGDLFSWSACQTGIYVGIIVAFAIIVLSWIIDKIR